MKTRVQSLTIDEVRVRVLRRVTWRLWWREWRVDAVLVVVGVGMLAWWIYYFVG